MGRSLGPLEMVLLLWLSIVPLVLFVRDLNRVLRQCSPESRSITPARVWLLVVPLFNYVWQVVVVISVAGTLAAEFEKRRLMKADLDLAKITGYGMAGCILAAPLWNASTMIPAIACWLLYWWEIRRITRVLGARQNRAASA